ncbi:Acetoin utilization protein AcuC [subsurface metagenome]
MAQKGKISNGASRKAVFIYSQELEEYQYPPEHPFNTIRAKKVREIVNSMGLLSGPGPLGASRREVAPVPAERIVLKKFHSARYVHALKEASEGKFNTEALSMGLGTPDCPVFKGMYDGAALAVGGTLVGAKLILSGSADVAFNPSGGFHHAGPERASGFCYINDVALACIILAEEGKRVLYLDVDVHHGDGVAYAFYDRRDVMTISFHQSGRTLFPGTGFEDEIGTGQGAGYCVNVPLPVGTFDEAYMKAFEALALPLIGAFSPDIFVFELGADALAGDPLANLQLTNNVYVDIINHLLSFDRPILATGGGGYDVDNTVRAWALAWSFLCGGGGSQQEGLRDKTLAVSGQQRDAVTPRIETTIEAVKANVFSYHGL